MNSVLAQFGAILHQLELLVARLPTDDVVVFPRLYAHEVDGFSLFLTFTCHGSSLGILSFRTSRGDVVTCY